MINIGNKIIILFLVSSIINLVRILKPIELKRILLKLKVPHTLDTSSV